MHGTHGRRTSVLDRGTKALFCWACHILRQHALSVACPKTINPPQSPLPFFFPHPHSFSAFTLQSSYLDRQLIPKCTERCNNVPECKGLYLVVKTVAIDDDGVGSDGIDHEVEGTNAAPPTQPARRMKYSCRGLTDLGDAAGKPADKFGFSYIHLKRASMSVWGNRVQRASASNVGGCRGPSELARAVAAQHYAMASISPQPTARRHSSGKKVTPSRYDVSKAANYGKLTSLRSLTVRLQHAPKYGTPLDDPAAFAHGKRRKLSKFQRLMATMPPERQQMINSLCPSDDKLHSELNFGFPAEEVVQVRATRIGEHSAISYIILEVVVFECMRASISTKRPLFNYSVAKCCFNFFLLVVPACDLFSKPKQMLIPTASIDTHGVSKGCHKQVCRRHLRKHTCRGMQRESRRQCMGVGGGYASVVRRRSRFEICLLPV